MKNTIKFNISVSIAYIFFMTMTCNLYSQIATTGIGESVDNYLSKTEPFGFSGDVLVAENGEILLNKGYGFADRDKKIKNNPNSVFSTGSVTKQFTAAAIMKLEMMGKTNTNDKITKYFKNVPSDKQDITLHNLLTHTSGLPHALGDDFEQISKEDYLDKALNTELYFKPGDRFSYSNVGYVLLAMIIEKESGLSYEAFLQEYLFKPSGMYQTGYNLPKWKDENFVHIYDGDIDNGTTKMFTKPTWHLIGNGGILSTTEDMFKWVQALKNNTVLSPEVTAKIFTAFKNDYGFGWDVLDDGNLRQHNGGSTLGLGAELRWFVSEDLVTIIFTNGTINDNLGFMVVRNELEALTFGDTVPLPPKVVRVSKDIKPFIGEYQFMSGQKFKIENKNNNAYLIMDNQELLDLIDDTENYKQGGVNVELNRKFENAFDKAFKSGDYSGFSFTENVEALESQIKNEIKMEGIQNPHFKILKTTRSNQMIGAYETQVAINGNENFEGESLMLHIVTDNGKFAGMGADFGFVSPISLNLIPIGGDKFQAYSLTEKIGALIEISKLNGNKYSFKVNGKAINVSKI